ncbi:MAG: TetR/AcrR family transcriptional regulator [Ilumatobacteraceae bacterium]|nr:TetR/AcrR family transcriptional regulator [Ilumatobacteraceae bacterium]
MSESISRRPGRPLGGQLVVDREHVLDAAERVIRRDGAGSSLEAVAVEAGVTKPIVYDRVGGRADLADALAERLADRMVLATRTALAGETLSQTGLTRFIEANLRTVADHRELFLYVTGGSTEQTALGRLSLAERSTTPLTKTLAVWRSGIQQDPGVAEAWAFGIVGMLQMVSQWWITQEDLSAAEVAGQISELLWNGLPGRA